MRDKVLQCVKEYGPVLPVEVASKIGENSFIAGAFLEELAESNEIVASKEKVGPVRLFYMKEQEAEALDRLTKLAPKPTKTVNSYAKTPIRVSPELEKKRGDFAARLQKIEEKEKVQKQVKSPELEVPSPPKKINPIPQIQIKPFKSQTKIIPKTPPLRAVGSFIRSRMSKPTPLPTYNPPNENIAIKADTFEESALLFLREKGIKLISEPEEVGSKETQVRVNVPSGVGPVKFLVKIKSKKKLNKSDLMQYYAEALEKRMPIILLLEGELATTAKTYLKEAGGFLRVKIFK